jgi:hypothetical protein
MIYAQANYTADSRLHLVICYPNAQDNKIVTVADESQARRLVYFHNCQFIKLHLTEWLGQRINAFKHADVNEEARIKQAEALIESITKHSNALHVQCRKVIAKTPALMRLAPSSQSRHYDTFKSDILPIIKFCHDLEGVAFNQD